MNTYSVKEIFQNLKYSIMFLSCDEQLSIVKNLIYTLRLNESDTNIAFETVGLKTVGWRDIYMTY